MKQNIEALVKDTQYQLFLLTCPASHPFAIAVHPWFVTVKPGGDITRYEIRHFNRDRGETRGYMYKNIRAPFEGIEQVVGIERFTFNATLVGMCEGEEGSLAYRMVQFVEKSFNEYEHAHTYHFVPGPNSNSYAQWILNQFPEVGWQLPWNAFGKGYAKYL